MFTRKCCGTCKFYSGYGKCLKKKVKVTQYDYCRAWRKK